MIIPEIKPGYKIQVFTDSGPELNFTLAGKVGEGITEHILELLPLTDDEIKAYGEDYADQLEAINVMFPTYIPINTIVLTTIMNK